MNNSLNSPFKFSLLKSSSEYHISTQVQIDNTSFMILRNFSTGKCVLSNYCLATVATIHFL